MCRTALGWERTLNQPMTEYTVISKLSGNCTIWMPLMSLTAVRVIRLSLASSIAFAMLSEACLSCAMQVCSRRSWRSQQCFRCHRIFFGSSYLDPCACEVFSNSRLWNQMQVGFQSAFLLPGLPPLHRSWELQATAPAG